MKEEIILEDLLGSVSNSLMGLDYLNRKGKENFSQEEIKRIEYLLDKFDTLTKSIKVGKKEGIM